MIVVSLAWVPPQEALTGLLDRLRPDDRARAERFVRPGDRARSAVASLVRLAVAADLLGVAESVLSVDRTCLLCDENGDDAGHVGHGKPRILTSGVAAPIDVSTSHAGNLVAVSATVSGTSLGVDVESCDRDVNWERLSRTVFTGAEWDAAARAADPVAARWAGWTRKEAVLKATGHGLVAGLTSVTVAPDPDPGQPSRDGTLPIETMPPRLVRSVTSYSGWSRATLALDAGPIVGWVTELPVPRPYAGSVAVLGGAPSALVTGWEPDFLPPSGAMASPPSRPSA